VKCHVTDFDPNIEPATQEQADAYVSWCGSNFVRLATSGPWTYRTALRCAHWLLVVALAQLHLDDRVDDHRDALLEQLAGYQRLARVVERQRDHVPAERLIILRSSLDCWRPTGDWAAALLNAGRDAVSALLLIEMYPLVDLWELHAPDAWALLDDGRDQLSRINRAACLTFSDFSIQPDGMVVARYTWQRANNIARHVGIRLSEN
jgi:hypothetical protein